MDEVLKALDSLKQETGKLEASISVSEGQANGDEREAEPQGPQAGCREAEHSTKASLYIELYLTYMLQPTDAPFFQRPALHIRVQPPAQAHSFSLPVRFLLV